MKRSIGHQPERSQTTDEEIVSGTIVWYQDGAREPYRKGMVESIVSKRMARVRDIQHDDIVTIEMEKISRADVDFDLNDCAELKCLTYPNVLENLRVRYEGASHDPRKIYTSAGWVLLCINPYYPTDALYTDEVCEEYFKQPLGTKPPHPFAIASTAFEHLIADGESQYILVSGESGGGKTECSKHLLKYLTWVTWRNRQHRGRQSLTGGRRAGECRLSALLLASNPILEFFGNAKTKRNANSSRFGKLYRLFYTTEGDLLTSAELATYLLAKSRVVNVPAGEENYHVFHALVNNLPTDVSSAPSTMIGVNIFGPDISTFSSNFLGNDGDSERYANPTFNFHLSRLVEAFELFDVDMNMQYRIYRTLAGILYLGSVVFIEDLGRDVKIADLKPMERALELWEMPGQAPKLLEVLTRVQIRDTSKVLTVSEATSLLHSLCKGVYECLFHEVIVKLIKEKLHANRSAMVAITHGAPPDPGGEGDCVGVLDLFGFENLENGFEQLCINYANEELHNHFMAKLITNEIHVLTKEGVVSESAIGKYKKCINNDALSFFNGNPSIFTYLEEASRLNHTDAEFHRRVTELISRQVAKNGKKRKVPAEQNNFTVFHYAEPVTYNCKGFVRRNSDYLSQSLIDFLQSCPNTFVGQMFPQAAVRSKKTATISETFRKQMSNLLTTLQAVECYFIKCIKPNGCQEAFGIDIWSIHRQLTTGGVSPMLQLMRAGYPCRLNFNSLQKRFAGSFPAINALRPSEFVELILHFLDVPEDEYKVGLSKVFFRFGVYHKVEKCLLAVGEDEKTRTKFCNSILKYRTVYLFYQTAAALGSIALLRDRLIKRRQRLKWKRLAEEVFSYYNLQWNPRQRERAAVTVQRWFRTCGIWRIFFFRRIRALYYIQLWWKNRLLIRYLEAVDNIFDRIRATRVLTAVIKGCCLRIKKRDELHRTAATIIQKHCRGYLIRRCIRKLTSVQQQLAAFVIQALLRRYLTWPAKKRADLRQRLKALEQCNTPAATRTPLQGRTPVKREKPSSPEFGTCKSRRAKAGSGLVLNQGFQRTVDYWELETDRRLPPEEKFRRRLSLFVGASAATAVPSHILGRLVGSVKPRVSTVENAKPITPLRSQKRSLNEGIVLQHTREFESRTTSQMRGLHSNQSSAASSVKRPLLDSRHTSRSPSVIRSQQSQVKEISDFKSHPPLAKNIVPTVTGDTASDDGFQTAREYVPILNTPVMRPKESATNAKTESLQKSALLSSISKKSAGLHVTRNLTKTREMRKVKSPTEEGPAFCSPKQPPVTVSQDKSASRFSFAVSNKTSLWSNGNEPLTEVVSDESDPGVLMDCHNRRQNDEPQSKGIATEVIEKEIRKRIGDDSSSDSYDEAIDGVAEEIHCNRGRSSQLTRSFNMNSTSKSPRFEAESSGWSTRVLSHTICSLAKSKLYDESVVTQIMRNKKSLAVTDNDRFNVTIKGPFSPRDDGHRPLLRPPISITSAASNTSFEPSSEVPDELGGRGRQSIRAWRGIDDETPLIRKQHNLEEDKELVIPKEAGTPLFGENRSYDESSRSVNLTAALSGIENAPPSTRIEERLRKVLKRPWLAPMKYCDNPSGHTTSKIYGNRTQHTLFFSS